jgi:branched-chain amino acid transport system permease protein
MRSFRWWLIFIAVMCVLPLFIPSGVMRFLVYANFVAVWAMSWDILSGYTGYVSFGHPFIIGTASYASAILTHQFGFPLYGAMALGVLIGVGAGMAFFFPALRVRGPYFALVTLALMDLAHRLVIAIRPDVTGGTRGLVGLPLVVTGGLPGFYMSLSVMFAVALSLWYVARSDIGTLLRAIHMDEDVVATEGFSTLKYKLLAFFLSALVASIGGVLYTHYLGSVSPEAIFGNDLLFMILIAALIGGQNSIIGPMVGAYFVIFLLEMARPYFPGESRFILYAALALGVYVFRPTGFYGIAIDIRDWYRRRRKKQYA